MRKKPDMVIIVITLFFVSVLASSVAQSALLDQETSSPLKTADAEKLRT